MRYITLFLTAAALQAQNEYLPSPVRIGGVNCAELQMQEAFATGTGYTTWKSCRDTFGSVNMQLYSETNQKTFEGYSSGNIFYGSQIWRALGGVDTKASLSHLSGNVSLLLLGSGGYPGVSIGTSPGGYGQLLLKDINGDSDAKIDAGSSGNGARVALNASDTARVGAELKGGTFSGGGQANLYNAASVLTVQLDNLTGLRINDQSTGGARIASKGAGWDLFMAAPTTTPPAGYAHLHINGSGQICTRNPSGTDSCVATIGGYVSTDATVQAIAGRKDFNGGARWSTYGELSTSSSPNMTLRSPTGSGNETIIIQGGSGSEDSYAQGWSHDVDRVGWDARALRGGGAEHTLYNPSGVVAVDLRSVDGYGIVRTRMAGGALGVALEQNYVDMLAGSSFGNPSGSNQRLYFKTGSGLCWKNSSGTETCPGAGGSGYVDLTSAQSITGVKEFVGQIQTSANNGLSAADSAGNVNVYLRNRFAENGLLVSVTGNDVADIMPRGSAGSQMTMRMEGRFGLAVTYLDSTKKELQFGDMAASYPLGIGLMANVDGAGVGKGDYFKWLGFSSGYVGFRAPSTAGNVIWTLPASDASGCLASNGAGTLSIASCGGSSSTLASPVNIQTAGVNKVLLTSLSGRGYVSLASSAGFGNGLVLDGNGNIQMRDPSTGSLYSELNGNDFTLFVPGGSGTAYIGVNGSSAGEIALTNSLGNIQARINQSGYQFAGNVGFSGAFTIPGTGCSLFYSGGLFINKSGC